jgi:hypothetical protein
LPCGGEQAHTPPVQVPLQQSAPVVHASPMRSQHWPPWQRKLQQSAGLVQLVPLVRQQAWTVLQPRPAQQSAAVVQPPASGAQHAPCPLHVSPWQHGTEALQLSCVRAQQTPWQDWLQQSV